jgi:hypothetical protein
MTTSSHKISIPAGTACPRGDIHGTGDPNEHGKFPLQYTEKDLGKDIVFRYETDPVELHNGYLLVYKRAENGDIFFMDFADEERQPIRTENSPQFTVGVMQHQSDGTLQRVVIGYDAHNYTSSSLLPDDFKVSCQYGKNGPGRTVDSIRLGVSDSSRRFVSTGEGNFVDIFGGREFDYANPSKALFHLRTMFGTVPASTETETDFLMRMFPYLKEDYGVEPPFNQKTLIPIFLNRFRLRYNFDTPDLVHITIPHARRNVTIGTSGLAHLQYKSGLPHAWLNEMSDFSANNGILRFISNQHEVEIDIGKFSLQGISPVRGFEPRGDILTWEQRKDMFLEASLPALNGVSSSNIANFMGEDRDGVIRLKVGEVNF